MTETTQTDIWVPDELMTTIGWDPSKGLDNVQAYFTMQTAEGTRLHYLRDASEIKLSLRAGDKPLTHVRRKPVNIVDARMSRVIPYSFLTEICCEGRERPRQSSVIKACLSTLLPYEEKSLASMEIVAFCERSFITHLYTRINDILL